SGDRYYNFNEEGSLLLESNVLLQKAPPVSFVALTPVKAVSIPREVLLQKLAADPDLSLEVMLSLSYKFLAAMDQVREATQCNVAWKVCNLLLTFAERYGVDYDGKTLIKEKISQQMLANLLGVNRITMVRTVKELRELGLIEQVNGFYCIRDRQRMLEFMGQVNDPPL
ncbi:MAG: Crp/Fnr family transcriptional regulator, partial [Gemmiger sp.]